MTIASFFAGLIKPRQRINRQSGVEKRVHEISSMKMFADQLWEYMLPKINELLSRNISFFRAQVVSNPGGGMLEVERPLENGTLTIPCTTAMSGAAEGQQVTVFVFGSLSNAVVVADGKMNFTL